MRYNYSPDKEFSPDLKSYSTCNLEKKKNLIDISINFHSSIRAKL